MTGLTMVDIVLLTMSILAVLVGRVVGKMTKKLEEENRRRGRID